MIIEGLAIVGAIAVARKVKHWWFSNEDKPEDEKKDDEKDK